MLNEGMILDIQRCSMHDGPGIRTTVFLKGCPLSCSWCHNPESQSFKPQLGYFKTKCVSCRCCESVCKEGVHQFEHGKHVVNYLKCTACGDCIEQCPHNALKIYGQKRTVEEVIKIVQLDQVYYEQTGGGLTISGGEPLSQVAFVKELLKTAKSLGIHTCIETSGYAPRASFLEIMPFTDYFLFDYKISGEAAHRKHTGVGQQWILENLELLYNNGKKIKLRCPIVPDINDTVAHREAVQNLLNKYPLIEGVEWLEYHDLWKTKAEAIGREVIQHHVLL